MPINRKTISIAVGAGLLLAEAWRRLLGPGTGAVATRHYHALYGRSQIAKYLPGNVFHLVGRQVLGRALGVSQARLAVATAAAMVSHGVVSVENVATLPDARRRGYGEALT